MGDDNLFQISLKAAIEIGVTVKTLSNDELRTIAIPDYKNSLSI